jgi:hypothetical protein
VGLDLPQQIMDAAIGIARADIRKLQLLDTQQAAVDRSSHRVSQSFWRAQFVTPN